MTPERWERIEALFAAALELDPAERPAFVAAGAVDDPELRDEVQALLEAHDSDPGYLDSPPPWLAATDPDAALGPDGEPGRTSPAEPVPERIGPYRILRPIGRGGMGQVYLAERQAAEFRQMVALKVMRRGLDTDDLIRRFRSERQILASLDHPSIARLLDVGATDTGLPYFVMEHIEGDDILHHCDGRRLPVRARLDLFRTVCSAVHHAHQNLVVHRDLKPANILVTGAGQPKLLDFGIAKILDPARDAEHATTIAGQRLLTPEYAAPEQLRGDVVTTGTDVYALGVLLYELLAGRHPYADGADEGGEVWRSVTEVEPAPPSAAVPRAGPDAAAARGTSVAQLRRALEGDLDTIVLKALRKEPEERYASAFELAEDVRRTLEGLPVHARPATVRYKLRKFARRNRTAVAAGVALFLLLTGFSGVTAYQARRVRDEAARVTRERDKAQEVRVFLLESFGSTGPDQEVGGSISVRELLDRRVATLEEAYSADPDLQAEMTGVLAEAYEKLGLYREAEPLARRALEAKRAIHGPLHADVAASLNVLGWLQRRLGDLPAAETTLREAVEVGRAVFPAHGDARLARALNDLGVVREAQGEYDEAATHYRQSMEMRRRVLGEEHVGVAVTTNNLAIVLYRQGRLAEAVEMAQRAVDSFTRSLGADHQRTAIALGNLAGMRAVQGDHEGAAETYARILDRHRRVLGDRHAMVAYTLTARANQLVALDRHTEAEPLLVEALSIEREVSGPRHERVAQTLRVLGDVVAAGGRHEEALRHWTEGLEIARAALGPEHSEVAALTLRSARGASSLGRLARAEQDFRAAARLFAAASGQRHYHTADARLSLAEFLADTGRRDEAGRLLAEVAPVIEELGPSFEPMRRRVAALRARLP